MNKEDLYTGMLVEFRNGEVAMTINDNFVTQDDWHNIDCWDSLRFDRYREDNFDIMKVSTICYGSFLMPKYWTSEVLNCNLLWKREEEESNEMTIEELEKLTGLKNLKIKK